MCCSHHRIIKKVIAFQKVQSRFISVLMRREWTDRVFFFNLQAEEGWGSEGGASWQSCYKFIKLFFVAVSKTRLWLRIGDIKQTWHIFSQWLESWTNTQGAVETGTVTTFHLLLYSMSPWLSTQTFSIFHYFSASVARLQTSQFLINLKSKWQVLMLPRSVKDAGKNH